MPIEVSNYSLSTYRTCPKKYYWHYIENLKPRRQKAGLTLGTVIHDSFDMYYKGKTITDIVTIIDRTYKESMGFLPPEEAEQAYLDSKTALGMFLNFPFEQMKFDKIESEREFKVALAKGIDYVGRIDGKVLHQGHKWIREVKTTGETRQMFQNRASISSQATGYVWGIQEADNEPISGVLYDGLRKPRLIKKQSEDMYEFGQRIYLDYCDAKKKDSYFYRYPTYRSKQDIDLWKADTIATARQILKDKVFPRNTGSCWMFNSECEYKKICFEPKPDPMVLELLYEERGGKHGRKEADVSGEASGGDSTAKAVPR